MCGRRLESSTRCDNSHANDPTVIDCTVPRQLLRAGGTHTYALSAAVTRPLVWHSLQSNRRVTCALRERTTKTKPAGESCRARGRRSRLQMMPKWCPGPAPCRLAGGTAPMVTLGADGAVVGEGRERDQPSVTLLSHLLAQRAGGAPHVIRKFAHSPHAHREDTWRDIGTTYRFSAQPPF